MRTLFDRFDDRARRVIGAAFDEAAAANDDAVGTEHLLLALATDQRTATLLTEARADPAGIRARWDAKRGCRPEWRSDHESLLGTLGIDLPGVRRRAHETFGADAVARAARRGRVTRPRRRLWTWISCSKPLPRRRCLSPLTGHTVALIPRVKRLFERAARQARPGLASPEHLLLALVKGDEPACELLESMGADVAGLAVAVRDFIDHPSQHEQLPPRQV